MGIIIIIVCYMHNNGISYCLRAKIKSPAVYFLLPLFDLRQDGLPIFSLLTCEMGNNICWAH